MAAAKKRKPETLYAVVGPRFGVMPHYAGSSRKRAIDEYENGRGASWSDAKALGYRTAKFREVL